jgi:hypothetical protein
MSCLYVELFWARSWQGLLHLCRIHMVVCNRTFLEHSPSFYTAFKTFLDGLEHLSQGSQYQAGWSSVCGAGGGRTIVTLSLFISQLLLLTFLSLCCCCDLHPEIIGNILQISGAYASSLIWSRDSHGKYPYHSPSVFLHF